MTTRCKYLLLIAIHTAACIHSYSQNKPQLKFFHIGIEKGLSNNTVNCLLQDKTGFLWVGTDNGLNRYDGYQFVLVGGGNDKNTLVSQQVKCLYEDGDGIIWIGTNTGGLHRYDPSSGTIIHYTNDEKTELISDNNVRSICSDVQGNLWLATNNGLTCYERRSGKFRLYRTISGNEQSLPFNDARILCPSRLSGKIWVGTYHGLCLLDPATGKFQRSDFLNWENSARKHFQNESISSLYEDEKGRLWIGEYGVVVQYVDQVTGKFMVYPKSSNQVTAINGFARDNTGRLWIGSWDNLGIYDTIAKKFYMYLHDSSDPLSLSDNFISCILKDRNGFVWLGTKGGLNCFNPLSENFTVLSHKDNDPNSPASNLVRSIFKSKDGKLWLGYEHAGLDTGRLETGKFSAFHPSPVAPGTKEKIAAEKYTTVGDVAYYNSIFGGSYRLHERNAGFLVPQSDRYYPFIKKNEWIQSCITDRYGNTWIGTLGYGLYCFDPISGNITAFRSAYRGIGPSDKIPLKDIRSDISYGGVYDIIEARNGKIWVATPEGLNRYDPGSRLFTVYKNDKDDSASLSFDQVKKLAEDKNGNIWAATYGGGICMLNVITGKFTRYKVPGANNNSSLKNIISLCISKDETVWAGSENGGIIRIHPGRHDIRLITTEDGLPDNSIAGILEDRNGYLWISTLKGLCKFAPKNNNEGHKQQGAVLRIFTTADGLPSNEFQKDGYYKDEDGRMYFGNTGGIVSFIPEDFKDQPFDVPLVFTGIQLFNHPLSPGDSTGILSQSITTTKDLKLKYNQNIITLSFAALGFIDADNIKYSHRLVGFNNQWFASKQGERSMTYTSLQPGKYIFEVKAENMTGAPVGKTASLGISVTPPFWKTLWFQGLVLATISLLIYLFYRWRMRIAIGENKKKSAIDRKIAELSLTALRSRMNPHFIFNSLSSLQYLIQNMDNNKAETYVNDLSQLIRAMLENSDKPMIPLCDELEMLQKYIELESMRFNNRFDFSINVAEDIETEYLELPSMLIQPFVENSIVHAFRGKMEKGHISITMTMKDNLLYCAIEDNGIGRLKAARLKENGTKHKSIATDDTKNRMDIMNKMMEKNVKLQIIDLVNEKQEPAGTRVELFIPVKEVF